LAKDGFEKQVVQHTTTISLDLMSITNDRTSQHRLSALTPVRRGRFD